MRSSPLPRALLRLAALAALTFRLAGADPTPPASAADQAWQAFQDAYAARPAVNALTGLPPAEIQQAIERYYAAVQARGAAFIEQYPSDPRRWTVVMRLSPTQPRFVKAWETDERGAPRPVIDEKAATAWKARYAELRAALPQAPDLPDEVREQLRLQDAMVPFNAATIALRNGQKLDLAYLRGKVVSYAARHPEAPSAAGLLYSYMGLFEKTEPGRTGDEWASFIDSPNRAVAEMATTKAGAAGLLKRPLEIAFTAVDGRSVDLKALRGKVVLVDFWATWCGPCIAELPNVKRVHADYHARGFEVVGIALENAGLTPNDTPDQTAAKLAKARAVLTSFTTREQMPWPQHFDGRYWKNEISTRYGISSIPAMFLLDQDGRIVSTNARGGDLEREVKRLLAR